MDVGNAGFHRQSSPPPPRFGALANAALPRLAAAAEIARPPEEPFLLPMQSTVRKVVPIRVRKVVPIRVRKVVPIRVRKVVPIRVRKVVPITVSKCCAHRRKVVPTGVGLYEIPIWSSFSVLIPRVYFWKAWWGVINPSGKSDVSQLTRLASLMCPYQPIMCIYHAVSRPAANYHMNDTAYANKTTKNAQPLKTGTKYAAPAARGPSATPAPVLHPRTLRPGRRRRRCRHCLAPRLQLAPRCLRARPGATPRGRAPQTTPRQSGPRGRPPALRERAASRPATTQLPRPPAVRGSRDRPRPQRPAASRRWEPRGGLALAAAEAGPPPAGPR
eukprot:364572-Chlamydomonas_euryale.AAC.4